MNSKIEKGLKYFHQLVSLLKIGISVSYGEYFLYKIIVSLDVFQEHQQEELLALGVSQ